MLRRALILLPGCLALVLGALQVGCGDDDTGEGVPPVGIHDAFVPRDGGFEPGGDMAPAAPDAGAQDRSGFPANAEAGFALDSAGAPMERASCYGPESGLDCGDESCALLPACCVGSTDELCCSASGGVPETVLGAGGCTTVDCIDGTARAFGSPGPTLSDGLVSGGDTRGDGGIYFEPPVDLRNRSVTLEGTFQPPTSDCADGCFETIGLALLRDRPPAGVVLARPAVALRYSGGLGAMIVEANGEVLAQLGEDPSGPWSLRVTPEGSVHVSRDGDEVLALGGRVQPAVVYPAVVGRTRNPSASGGEAAMLTQLQIGYATCDMPTGWSTGAEVDFTAPPSDPHGPSLLFGDSELLAFTDAGELHIYRWTGADRFDPWVSTPGPGEVASVRDAVLAAGPGAAVEVVATTSSGAVVAGVLRTDPSPAIEWASAPLLPACGCERTSPTVGTTVEGTQVLLVLEDGAPKIYARMDGSLFLQVDASAILEETLAVADDERLTGIALALHHGAWQLHATYARGTRSLVRQFVSEELLVWRAMGIVFEPSRQGFDALTVEGFSVVPDASGALRAVYVGGDGVGRRIGTSIRPTG